MAKLPNGETPGFRGSGSVLSSPMSFLQFKRRLSLLVGWAADRRIPGPLRSPVYKTYARLTGADLRDMRGHIRDHGSLGAFFVRRLKEGAREIEADPDRMPSPVDSMIQALSPVSEGSVIEAKARTYPCLLYTSPSPRD